MTIKLYVDDERPCPDGWVSARTYDDAMLFLESKHERVEVVSLDHDLGEDKTGYDIACVIERMVHEDSRYHPPIILVHSANPVGRANIERVIAAIERYQTHDAWVKCPSPYCSAKVPVNIGDTLAECQECATSIGIVGGFRFTITTT